MIAQNHEVLVDGAKWTVEHLDGPRVHLARQAPERTARMVCAAEDLVHFGGTLHGLRGRTEGKRRTEGAIELAAVDVRTRP